MPGASKGTVKPPDNRLHSPGSKPPLTLGACDAVTNTARPSSSKLVQQANQFLLSGRLLTHLLQIIQHEQLGRTRPGPQVRQTVGVERVGETASEVSTAGREDHVAQDVRAASALPVQRPIKLLPVPLGPTKTIGLYRRSLASNDSTANCTRRFSSLPTYSRNAIVRGVP